MTQYRVEYRYCGDCGDERPFEQFHAADCPDVAGTGANPDLDCPEWGCTACGSALIVGLAISGYISDDSVSQAA